VIDFSNKESNKFGLTVGYIFLISGLFLAAYFFIFIFRRIYLTNFRLQEYLLYCIIILLCSGLLSLCFSITSFWIGDIYIIIGITFLFARLILVMPSSLYFGLFYFFYTFLTLFGGLSILPAIILILIGRKLRRDYDASLSFIGTCISCWLIYLYFSMFFPVYFL